jgi:arylsulfatase A-like enzyme
MKKIIISQLVIILLFFNFSFAQNKPNIIFILADDYGTAEVGAYGADNYKTPNIDMLAKSGVQFNHCYTAALCGPSRALILTGRYAFRTGATNQDKTGKFTPKDEVMIPTMLTQAGYISTSIGKWGQLPLMPSDFGFDSHLTFRGSGIYWNTQDKGKNYFMNEKTIPLNDNEYMPDLMHQNAVEFLVTNKNNPFFLYYSLSHVHNQILPTPDSKTGSNNLYAENISYMDKLVGKLMHALDSLNLLKNTLVIFMGDNGTAKMHADDAKINGKKLSGSKGTMLEGGGLVPLIAYWKGVSAEGKISNMMVDASDVFPTIMELAGIKSAVNKIDGESILPEIKGKPSKHRNWAYNQLANMYYVRELNWKLNEKGELFNMTKAPFEEILIPLDSKDKNAIEARLRLQKVLATINPAGGIIDDGDGTGRHASKNKD